MLRSVLAVLAGFASWTALWLTSNQALFRLFRSRFDDDMLTRDSGLLLVVLGLSLLFSIVAGWVTATVAKRRGMAHAFALGVLQVAVGTFVQSQVWDAMPLWYHLIFLVLLLPGNLLGAKLESSRH